MERNEFNITFVKFVLILQKQRHIKQNDIHFDSDNKPMHKSDTFNGVNENNFQHPTYMKPYNDRIHIYPHTRARNSKRFYSQCDSC